ncbi:hypothetical protein ANANG_G00127710 [Anguilla anguilla]|uniref:ZZ-type zinc finger-containing protein 3 n=1 Tax=Anguilla anguilla TaxID=7936 RepID=A0A9D3MK10_ANGAN|nr:hypothetical protein ANANG_G00127710 [Anguilla anguilla]
MAAPRSTRVTRSSVGINGLDENFCGRTLRNRSIAQPEESQAKRAKRCSRSGDAPGSEEDSPGKAERPARDPTEGGGRPGERRGHARPRPDRLRPPPDERDREENAGGRRKGTTPGVRRRAPQGRQRAGRAAVGGRGACPESSEPSPGDARVPSDECQRNSTLALPNGGQADSATPSDPHVPCKNSNPERAEPDGPVMAEEPPTLPAPRSPAPAREPEEEVDVVGTRGGRRPGGAGRRRRPPKNGRAPSSGRGPASGQGTECSGEAADTAGGEAGVSEASVPKSTKEPAGSQAAEEDEDEEDPDVYYFESDHLALKHNKDYQRLLQTISVLEAQRTQAVLDLESLARHQREALRDPISFVEKLQKQVGMGLPCPQRVVQLPDIAWDQYTSGLGDFEREFRDKKRNTRRLKLIFDKVGLPARPKSPLDSRKEGEPSALYSALPSSDAPEHSASSSRTQMIRGRVCDQNKPDTFNQLWTVEEQKRLEQLLLKFPPEEVESKRWQKIADELGNRTAKQVASRVQKYFIKLTKAGIPVPGRTPNLCMYSKKASSKRQHHLNKHLYRPSTFLTSYEPPVYMDDEDDRSSFYSGLQDPTAEDSDEDGIPVEYRGLPEYKELLELKKLKKQKIHEIRAENALAQHMGYKVGLAVAPLACPCPVEYGLTAWNSDPILMRILGLRVRPLGRSSGAVQGVGVRWHCRDCPPDLAVDFCSNCSDCLYKTEAHKPSHQLDPVFQPETFLDRDYCLPQSAGYNYLDPNYFPANR